MTDDYDVSNDDIAAMRKQGDIKAFMRSRFRKPPTRQPRDTTPAPVTRIDRRAPGAWPKGTSPPSPVNQEIPGTDWQAALDEYRAWLRAGCPKTKPAPCECPACVRVPGHEDLKTGKAAIDDQERPS